MPEYRGIISGLLQASYVYLEDTTPNFSPSFTPTQIYEAEQKFKRIADKQYRDIVMRHKNKPENWESDAEKVSREAEELEFITNFNRNEEKAHKRKVEHSEKKCSRR
jgi:hypothetical protein